MKGLEREEILLRGWVNEILFILWIFYYIVLWYWMVVSDFFLDFYLIVVNNEYI